MKKAKFHYLDFSKFHPERKERGNRDLFGKKFLVSLFKNPFGWRNGKLVGDGKGDDRKDLVFPHVCLVREVEK